AIINDLFGKQHPLRQVDQVRAHVGYALALLLHIEEPRRADVRRAGDYFEEVMDALHVNRRVILRTFLYRPEDARVVDQLALQDRRDLRPLRHYVVGDQLLRIRRVQRRLQLGEVAGVNDPRLVDERVQAVFDASLDAIDFALIAPRDDN